MIPFKIESAFLLIVLLKGNIYSNDFYLSVVKYLFEIMLGLSAVLLGTAVYFWLQLESFQWEKDRGLVNFAVTAFLLVFIFGRMYLQKRKERAENTSEER